MSSVFGSSTVQQPNRFSNLTVKFPQNDQQQQQQQNATSLPQQQQNHGQIMLNSTGSASNFFTNEDNTPSWFNNPKKRTIPHSIVKRSAKASTSDNVTSNSHNSDTSDTKADFGSVVFGSRKVADVFGGSNGAPETDLAVSPHILFDTNEAPPTRSMYDWQREDEFGNAIPNIGSGFSTQQSLPPANKRAAVDSTGLRNAFDRLDGQAGINNKINLNSAWSDNSSASTESAVLVFGYPESISNQIIVHFAKFGSILEDFEVLRGASGINAATLRLRSKRNGDKSPHRKYPIFTGDGWIKLTYDSPSAAMRALQENGIVYGGCLVGCVPYNKSAVEQLASCKIEQFDDIGAFNAPSIAPNVNSIGIRQSPFDSMGTPEAAAEMDALEGPGAHAYRLGGRKIEIKDGKSLFAFGGYPGDGTLSKSLEDRMKDQAANKQLNGGIVSKVSNWLFGWNDL
ncbi:LAMI_0D13146g1_1 [Lachancea mirantina]|uniref:LAMI_0D13146g1_1 n=1 Tax=Lachancea mirantina TaxID=1230905 RepID=A0A1G4JGS0_9SACH|nr:LAMI_0D13146g1_1 [Lachancea mirantina]